MVPWSESCVKSLDFSYYSWIKLVTQSYQTCSHHIHILLWYPAYPPPTTSFLFPFIARFLLVSAFLNFIHSSGYTSLASLLTIWLKFLSRLPVFSVLLDLMDTLFSSSSSIPGICNTVYSWIVSISLVAPSQSPFLATFAFCLLSKCWISFRV